MIPVCEPSISIKEYIYTIKALKSNWLTCGGEFVNRFEQGIADYHNAKYGIALSSGTAALHMALLALGIGKGDEVIVPSLSFVAVASMVKLVGATPVVVDVNRDDWLIDTDKIEKAITKRTKAIIPVHLYGNRYDTTGILANTKHKIYVIEDSCEAIGTPLTGDIACLSYQSTKTLSCGEGGMCVTNGRKLADRIRFLKDHAMTADRKYYHTEVGFNYRMTELQAAIGYAQLDRLKEFLAKKRAIHSLYTWDLASIEGVKIQTYGKIPCTHWVTAILVEPSFGISRDKLMSRLKEAGIETRVMFYPIHLQPPYKQIGKDKCPVTTELSKKGMYLPSGVNLKKSQVEYICNKIKECKK